MNWRNYIQLSQPTVLAFAILAAVACLYTAPVFLSIVDGSHEFYNILEELWVIYLLSIPISILAILFLLRFRVAHILVSIILGIISIGSTMSISYVISDELPRFKKSIETMNVDQFGFLFFLISLAVIPTAFFLMSVSTEMRASFFKTTKIRSQRIFTLTTILFQSVPFWMVAAFGCVFVDDANFKSEILSGNREIRPIEIVLSASIIITLVGSLVSILLTLIQTKWMRATTLITTSAAWVFLFVFFIETFDEFNSYSHSNTDLLFIVTCGLFLLLVWLFYAAYFNTKEIKALHSRQEQQDKDSTHGSILDFELVNTNTDEL